MIGTACSSETLVYNHKTIRRNSSVDHRLNQNFTVSHTSPLESDPEK